MPADLKPSIDPADIARHLNAAIHLVCAAMDLIKHEEPAGQIWAVEAKQIWEVLHAADSRLCDIREAIELAREEV